MRNLKPVRYTYEEYGDIVTDIRTRLRSTAHTNKYDYFQEMYGVGIIYNDTESNNRILVFVDILFKTYQVELVAANECSYLNHVKVSRPIRFTYTSEIILHNTIQGFIDFIDKNPPTEQDMCDMVSPLEYFINSMRVRQYKNDMAEEDEKIMNEVAELRDELKKRKEARYKAKNKVKNKANNTTTENKTTTKTKSRWSGGKPTLKHTPFETKNKQEVKSKRPRKTQTHAWVTGTSKPN